MLVSRGSCPPLIGFTHWNKKKAADCKAMNLAVLDLIERRNIKLVLLHARWPQYVNGGPLGNEGPFFDPSLPFEETNNSTTVAMNLNTTLGELEKLNVRVIIISGVPEIGYDVPHLLARAAIDGKERDIEPTLAAVMQRQNNATELLQSAAAKGRIELLDPKSILCTAIKCRVVKEGSLLYRDEDHLTRHGAETLVSIFLPIFLH